MSNFEYQATRTKSGAFIHLQYTGTQRAWCGSRAPIRVRGKLAARNCCEKCFGSAPTNWNGKIEAVEITA